MPSVVYVWQYKPSPNAKLSVCPVQWYWQCHCLHRIIEQWRCSNNEEHINITNLGSSRYYWCYCARSAFLSFFSAHVSSHALPRFHPRLTRFLPRLSDLPRSLSRIKRNRDHGIVPMITESCQRPRPWLSIFSPRVVLNAFLERTSWFCSVFLI